MVGRMCANGWKCIPSQIRTRPRQIPIRANRNLLFVHQSNTRCGRLLEHTPHEYESKHTYLFSGALNSISLSELSGKCQANMYHPAAHIRQQTQFYTFYGRTKPEQRHTSTNRNNNKQTTKKKWFSNLNNMDWIDGSLYISYIFVCRTKTLFRTRIPHASNESRIHSLLFKAPALIALPSTWKNAISLSPLVSHISMKKWKCETRQDKAQNGTKSPENIRIFVFALRSTDTKMNTRIIIMVIPTMQQYNKRACAECFPPASPPCNETK